MGSTAGACTTVPENAWPLTAHGPEVPPLPVPGHRARVETRAGEARTNQKLTVATTVSV